MLLRIFQVALFAGCLGLVTSTIFSAMVWWAAIAFRRRSTVAPARFAPAVSILKPLHGDEPSLEENLRGFFAQDYPEFELLFCARSADDPALEIARRLAAQHPHVRCTVMHCGEAPYANAKVYSLATMQVAAVHDLLVVSDSDVRVTPDYLRRIVQPFADPGVGLVTCLYRGVAVEGGVWAQLEAVGMSIEMTAGAIVSAMLGPVEFALGPTMAARREAVAQIGGFAALGPYCSDDFLLGNWISRRGWRCVLSDHAIEHMVLNASFAESVRHQVRWMKSTRASLPKGHLGTGLTFSIPYALLGFASALVLHRPGLATILLTVGVLACVLRACSVGWMVVHERRMFSKSLLYVLRDAMGFFYWLASYTSRRILWRGEIFELQAEGRMRKVIGR